MSDDVRGREYRVQRQRAMTEALRELGRVWRTSFTPEKIEANLDLWLEGCGFVPTDMLLPTAKRFTTTAKKSDYAPRPGDFAKIGRELESQRATPLAEVGGIPNPRPRRDVARIHALYHVAAGQLRAAGHHKVVVPISQMWALLYAAQPTPELQEAVRDGLVDDAVWQQVIDAWLAGERPVPHPMNNMGLAGSAA